MATYYISSAATNGYVVGDDANDGLDPSTPWLSLDVVNGVGFSWSGSDTVNINGDIDCSTKFVVDNNITLAGVAGSGAGGARPTLTLLAGGAAADGISFALGKILTVTDLHLDGTVCTTSSIRLDSSFLAGGLSLTRCTVTFKVWGLFSSGGLADLDVVDCAFQDTGTSNGAAIYIIDCVSGDNLLINGLALTLSGAYTAGRGGVIIEADVADVTVEVSGVTGTITNSIATGYTHGVWISDAGTASIHDCDVTVNTTAGGSGSLYTITNPNNAATAVSIYDNHGYCNSPNGIMIGLGHDTYGAGGANGEVYNNDVRGPATVVGLHGIMARDGADIEVWNNRVRNAAIGYIFKLTTRGVLSHNVAEFLSGTAAFHLKGATNPYVTGNTYIISSASSPRMLYVQASDLTNSTGCIFAGNAVYIYPGQTVPTDLVEVVDASQTITFYGNNYYSKTTAFGTNWNDEGTSRTFASWIAQSHVYGDHSFSFVPRFMGRMDHRIMKVVK